MVVVRLEQIGRFIDIRDYYRDYLNPGKGVRVTIEALSNMMDKTDSLLNEFNFPIEVFSDHVDGFGES